MQSSRPIKNSNKERFMMQHSPRKPRIALASLPAGSVTEAGIGVENKPKIVLDSEYSSSAFIRIREPKLWLITLPS